MSLLRHYFSDNKRVRQRCKMLRFDSVPVLCLIFGLLVQIPKIVKADPQHGVAFPDGKTYFILFCKEKSVGKFGTLFVKLRQISGRSFCTNSITVKADSQHGVALLDSKIVFVFRLCQIGGILII